METRTLYINVIFDSLTKFAINNIDQQTRVKIQPLKQIGQVLHSKTKNNPINRKVKHIQCRNGVLC